MSAVALQLDLSQVSYIDTTGIATLLECVRFARERSRSLSLREPSHGVTVMLELTGLKDVSRISTGLPRPAVREVVVLTVRSAKIAPAA